MSVKIGRGRGKKGDGLHVDRQTKKRTYAMARSIYKFSNMQLEALLANPNTRNKDVPKIKHEISRRL